MNPGGRKADLEELAAIAAAQGGYFTTGQARRAGYKAPLLAYHFRVGNFERVGHGLYRLPLLPLAEHDDLVRLCLWSRNRRGQPQAVVSHQSALALHGLSDWITREVLLTVPPGFRKQAPRGCRLHKAALAVAETVAREGFRVTRVERCLTDLAAESSFPQALFDRALRLALQGNLLSSRRARSLAELRSSLVAGMPRRVARA
jgi:predicted transcriptional regulator of viral defense system